MLIKISNDIILNIDKVLSIEKSLRCSILVYFCDRQDPCSYLFSSYDERNKAFEKIINNIKNNKGE